MQPHLVTHLDVLPLAYNPISVVHSASNEVLEPRVAIETAAGLSDLHKPGPDICQRRIDRNRVSILMLWMRNKVVAGKLPLSLRVCCAPPQLPGANQ